MLTGIEVLGQKIRMVGRVVLAWLLPPACIGCRTHLPAHEPVGLCADCYGKLPWWNTALVMKPMLAKSVDSFAAPCFYEAPLREVILNLKFHDHTHTARALAKLMLPHLPRGEGYVLVPVPSHPKRLRQRFYNHALLLAEELGRLTGHAVARTALVRTVYSTPQNSRTRAQRMALPGSHFAADTTVAGRRVILIDDIYTTGSTARACSLALKRAGAVRVDVVTLAYTRPH